MDILLYIILVLLIIIIVLLIFLLLRKNKQDNSDVIKELGEFKYNISDALKKDYIELNKLLSNSQEKSNKTLINLSEKLTSINETNKMLKEASDDLQKVLTDKKTRGNFGETSLNNILSICFGEDKRLFDTQVTLSDGNRVDAIIYGGSSLRNICIDSKFPLENYLNMINSTSNEELKLYFKSFDDDVKKRIDETSKYLSVPETADYAIMFIPSEGIFLEIISKHQSLIDYAYKKHVMICGPTNLLYSLSLINNILEDARREKNVEKIIKQLINLKQDFDRYNSRWESLENHIKTVIKDLGEVSISSKKISKKFDDIYTANIDEKE